MLGLTGKAGSRLRSAAFMPLYGPNSLKAL